MPMPWAVAVCATEMLGSLLIVLRLAPRAGAPTLACASLCLPPHTGPAQASHHTRAAGRAQARARPSQSRESPPSRRPTGALLLLPKMAVATWGHAFVEGFDAKFAASYANAFTPPGLSYNWSLGASWECGFFGAGYFLLAYASILLLPPATGTPKAKSKTA